MLEEISMGTGDLIGGQDINSAFFQACTHAFKGGDWEKVSQKSHAFELLEMETDFESKKVVIGTDDPRDEYIKLAVPEIFQELMESGEIQLKDTSDVGHRFKFKGKSLTFDTKFIRETLFNETIQRILKLLRDILSRKQVQCIKHIVLVGGFSESPIVVGKIRAFITENFPGKEVVVPTSPFTAVMSGAVLYGHDPLIFNSRICRATYGIETNRPFDPEIHKEEKKWRNKESGEDWCKDIFGVHVKKGSSVKLGDAQPSRVYTPAYKDQTSVPLSIFMSTADNLNTLVYTTDEHCKKVGEIVVEMPDTTGGTDRKVTVTMIYGGTELDVIAKNELSGEECKAKIRFDTS